MSIIHRKGTQAHYFASGFLIFGAYKTADHPWLTKLVAPPFCVYLSHLGLRWASPDFTYKKPELYRGLNPLNSSWRSWILWRMMMIMTQPGWIIAEENGGMIWIWIVEISSFQSVLQRPFSIGSFVQMFDEIQTKYRISQNLTWWFCVSERKGMRRKW